MTASQVSAALAIHFHMATINGERVTSSTSANPASNRRFSPEPLSTSAVTVVKWSNDAMTQITAKLTDDFNNDNGTFDWT
jgi:hypothetical protein